jgi:hypothetical protein
MSVPDVRSLEAVGTDGDAAVLPGDLVRDLVNRNEDAIEALVARANEIEARAEAAERAVREHPGLALLDPAEASRLVTETPEPAVVDDGRPRTTVVNRPSYNTPAGAPRDGAPTRVGTGAPAGESASTGFFGRLATSHWWWRIGIALVLVAVLLLKFG